MGLTDASKHIFVRDVFKCWYVKGINEEYFNYSARKSCRVISY